MADANMLPLVTYIRQYGNAATDDVFGATTYWTNDQLEELALGRGTYSSFKFNYATDLAFISEKPKHYWLRSGFQLYTEDDVLVNAATYTYKPLEGAIVFSTAQTYEPYFVAKGFTVHMWDALGDLWDRKASQRADYINFRAGHNVMNMREEYEHCVSLRDYYRAKTIRRWRRA